MPKVVYIMFVSEIEAPASVVQLTADGLFLSWIVTLNNLFSLMMTRTENVQEKQCESLVDMLVQTYECLVGMWNQICEV